MKPDFTTPMMQQYLRIKKQYPDCLLFFRVGDFYELFMEDAYIGAKVLDIVLTSRSKGRDGKIPLAGVPFHAVDSYLAKLVKAGYNVAICEQVTEPNKYGIVEREVIRIVTPGTVLDRQSLNEKENNHIITLVQKDNKFGLAVADLSTGLFQIGEYENFQAVQEEMRRLHPTECVVAEDLYNRSDILKQLKVEKDMNISCFHESKYYATHVEDVLTKQFGSMILIETLKRSPLALTAASELLGYIIYTQKDVPVHFKSITQLTLPHEMVLDYSTVMNLELFSTLRTQERQGTLIAHIDHTHTAMGGRLLRSWIRRPLIDYDEIKNRHDAVSFFIENDSIKENIERELKAIIDIERLLSRLSLGIGNGRDVVGLKRSLLNILTLKNIIKKSQKNNTISHLYQEIDSQLQECIDIIERILVEEPPTSIREGGLIKEGISEELDRIRKDIYENRYWLEEMEKKERDQTGISSLKVRFNRVFGFYIEVSNANLSHVPASYVRKQTLVNAERFITEELKKREDIILNGEEQIQQKEYELYQNLLKNVLRYLEQIQKAARAVAVLDCLIAFATLAEKYHYSRPHLLKTDEIMIEEGRHPVVERRLGDDRFVPNNTDLSSNQTQLIILTGPNMAGKSVYIRQVALIVLLNQIGSFVPATSARLGIVDRIFVRSGASDMISEGLSTFMVEMVETAQILDQATSKSLVIMDEIGRGTSTYDGISIAWAIAEYIVSNPNMRPKTLFATHYHELQELEKKYPARIKNYHMAVEEEEHTLVFLYTLLPEGASHSFGIAVAQLAGIPRQVIETAYGELSRLESGVQRAKSSNDIHKNIKKNKKTEEVIELVRKLDSNNMTPMEALTFLSQLQKKVL